MRFCPLSDLLTAFGQSLLFAFIGVLPMMNPLATAPAVLSIDRGGSTTSARARWRSASAKIWPFWWPAP